MWGILWRGIFSLPFGSHFFLLFVFDPSSNSESDLGNNKVLGGVVYFNEDIDFW